MKISKPTWILIFITVTVFSLFLLSPLIYYSYIMESQQAAFEEQSKAYLKDQPALVITTVTTESVITNLEENWAVIFDPIGKDNGAKHPYNLRSRMGRRPNDRPVMFTTVIYTLQSDQSKVLAIEYQIILRNPLSFHSVTKNSPSYNYLMNAPLQALTEPQRRYFQQWLEKELASLATTKSTTENGIPIPYEKKISSVEFEGFLFQIRTFVTTEKSTYIQVQIQKNRYFLPY